MRRILIWKKLTDNCEHDNIYCKKSHLEQCNIAIKNGGYNFGNKLWFQGLMSEIDNGENEYYFLNDNLTNDEINNQFDLIIFSMANIFNRTYLEGIKAFPERLKGIKIPIYVIACGAQAEGYEGLDSLIADIGKDSKRFISTIYQTGGEFALRGYFTKEFFSRLGFDSAVVTGCPSMYQLGRNFSLDDQKNNCIVPLFNGNLNYLEKIITKYPKSIYFDQDMFLFNLFKENHIPKQDFKSLLVYSENMGNKAIQLMSEKRIKLIPNMNDWRNYIIQNKFNYSFGSRIHGNIMSILSGVPATIIAHDSRTREMAEFFDIPHFVPRKNEVISHKEFLKHYEQLDYSKFNKYYQKRFDLFEDFLRNHSIVSKINENNKFFHTSSNTLYPDGINTNEFRILYKKSKRYSIPFKLAHEIIRIKNKI